MVLKLKMIISWLIVVWTAYIFLGSLPYKFTNAPDTMHIFGTIGDWLGTFFGQGFGQFFADFGPYIIGAFELLVSLVLLAPIILRSKRELLHALGGLMATAVMIGAVFFHLFSPLGWEVLHQGQSDGGSLATAATSILFLGLVLAGLNKDGLKDLVSKA